MEIQQVLGKHIWEKKGKRGDEEVEEQKCDKLVL